MSKRVIEQVITETESAHCSLRTENLGVNNRVFGKRRQLDYILVKNRFRNSVKDVQTLPGADIGSDHNLLVAKFRTRLKKIIRF